MKPFEEEKRIVGLGGGDASKRKTWEGYVNQSLIHPDSRYIKNTKYYEQHICPYCELKLPKRPSRKTMCKSCNNYIFVKTNYFINQKMLMTEDDSQLIKVERDLYYAKVELDKKRKSIIKGYYTWDEYTDYMLKHPRKTDYDIIVAIFKESEEEYIRTEQSGLYRSCKYSEYFFFVEEGKSVEALDVILECYYLELAATYDVITSLSEDMIDIYNKYYNAYLIEQIEKLKLELNYSDENIKAKFLKQLNRLNYPLKIQEAWEIIEEIKDRQKLKFTT